MAADRRDAGRLGNPEVEYLVGEGDPFEAAGSRSVSEIGVRQPIENLLTRHYRLGAMDREVAAGEEEARYGALEVDHEIRLDFYTILYLQQLVDLRRLNTQALDEVRRLTEARARAGEVKDLEAIRLRVEHLRAQNDLNAAELELEQSRRQMNMALGDALPADYVLEGALEDGTGGAVPEIQELTRDLLEAHPLIRQAELRTAAADQRVRASQFAWFPSPTVSASSGKELDGDILRFGIGLEVPLWNWSRAAVRRDREALAGMEHEEASLRLQLETQLMIHHNHLLFHRQTLELFREGLLEEADVSMSIAETSYREGEISLVEYLDARRTFQSIQIEYQQALYDWNREMAELDRAVGGGVL